LVVVQGGAGIQQGVADPASIFQEQGDVVAGLPGSLDVAPGFVLLEGLLVVAHRLAGVTGPAVDDAELVLDAGAHFVVVGGGEAEGLLTVANRSVEVFYQHRPDHARGRASSNRSTATEPSCARLAACPGGHTWPGREGSGRVGTGVKLPVWCSLLTILGPG
jgi:hypothetical protein